MAGRKWFDLTEEDIKKGRTEDSIISDCKKIWALDGTDSEAACFANVSTSSICRYLDAHPEIKELRNRLKETPFVTARQTIIKNLDNPQYAFEYMKRKKRLEFGDNVDHTTQGEKLKIQFDESFKENK